MTNTTTVLSHVLLYDGQSAIQTANGSFLPITTIGDASFTFTNVFLAPKLSSNLISVGQFVDDNYNVHFSSAGCVVQDQVTRKPIARGPKMGCLFPLFLLVPTTSSIKSFASNKILALSMVWHCRLSHPNTQILSHVLHFDFIGNKAYPSLSLECDSCKIGKSKILPFSLYANRASHCFDLIHSNVWGPSPGESYEKFKYYVTFIHDYSRFTWVYCLHSKSEVSRIFTKFLAYVATQFSITIKTLHTDFGDEYLSIKFQAFLASNDIIHQRSYPATPQQNGVAEQKNHHLLDVVRTLLLESSVPSMFWVEALKTATYLINRLPSQALQMESPFFHLFSKQPNYDNLCIFSYVCFVHLPFHERYKLSAQSVRCAFLGYNLCQKGFVCYDPTLRPTCIYRNVILFRINNSFWCPLCPLLQMCSSLHLSHKYMIFIQSALVLNQVLCIQDAPAHSLLQRLTRYLILPHSKFRKMMHHQNLWYITHLECLYPRIGMVFPFLSLVTLFQLLLLHYLLLIYLHVTHTLPSIIVDDRLCRKKYML